MCYIGPYSTYSTYSKERGESGCSVGCLVRYSTYSTYSKERGESGCSVGCLVRYSTYSTYSKDADREGSAAWRLPGIASRPRHLPGIEASSLPSPRQGRDSFQEKNRNCRLIRQFRRTLKPPRPRHLPGIEASCRARAKVGILPRKKMSRSSKPTTVKKKIQWSCGGTTV